MYVTPRQKKRYIINALFIAVAIPLTVLAGYTVTQLISDAATEAIPQNVALVTPTTNSVTVTWTTENDATSEVVVEEGSDSSEPFRDQRGTNRRRTHYVEVIDLAPDTAYKFTINSNNDSYTSEGGRPFEFKTSPLTDDVLVPRPVFGGIPNSPSDDSIVYVFTTSDPQSLPVATVPTSTGNWIVDLSGLKTLDGKSFVQVTDDSMMRIVVIGPEGTGSVHNGSFSETFTEDGELQSSVDLTLVENPTIINELPAESMVGSVTQGPEVKASCYESCESLNCESGLVCLDGVCKNASCPSEASCECPEEPKECNDTCSRNNDCSDDLICFEGRCRDSECTDDDECNCSPEFDPADRVFRLILDIPWIDMYPNGANPDPDPDPDPDPGDPEIVTGYESIKVVNQSDNTFGVIWMSDNPTTGYVRYGTSADTLDQEANDPRDGLVNRDTYHSHLVEVYDIQPETTYHYEIISGSETYDDNGQPFTFTTYETLSGPPPYGTVQGSVTNADPVDDVVVVLQLNDLDGEGSPGDSNLVATVLDSQARWVANIADARTQDGSQYFTYTEGDQMTAALYVFAETLPEIIPASEFEEVIELEVYLWQLFQQQIEFLAVNFALDQRRFKFI